jgi:hypothetical protein
MEGVMSKKCTPLWREPHFQVKMNETDQTLSGSWDVEKLHAVALPSQNVQNTQAPDNVWKLRCLKIARCVIRRPFANQNVQQMF